MLYLLKKQEITTHLPLAGERMTNRKYVITSEKKFKKKKIP